MRLFLTILGALAAVALLWQAFHWVLGLAWGLVHLAILAAVILFIVGLVRRLLRV